MVLKHTMTISILKCTRDDKNPTIYNNDKTDVVPELERKCENIMVEAKGYQMHRNCKSVSVKIMDQIYCTNAFARLKSSPAEWMVDTYHCMHFK